MTPLSAGVRWVVPPDLGDPNYGDHVTAAITQSDVPYLVLCWFVLLFCIYAGVTLWRRRNGPDPKRMEAARKRVEARRAQIRKDKQ